MGIEFWHTEVPLPSPFPLTPTFFLTLFLAGWLSTRLLVSLISPSADSKLASCKLARWAGRGRNRLGRGTWDCLGGEGAGARQNRGGRMDFWWC